MTTLKRQSIGAVGYPIQGWLFLETDDSLSKITEPGYLNALTRSTNIKVDPNDFIAASYGNDESGLFRVSFGANGAITMVAITSGGGGGGNFEYQNTFFVAKGGSNANDGKTVNTPKATIQGAINAFETPTTPSTIVIFDNGVYQENPVFADGANVKVIGPAATILVPGTITTPTNADLYFELWSLLREGGSGTGNVLIAILAGGVARADVKTISSGANTASAIACDNGGILNVNCESLTGTVVANDAVTLKVEKDWDGGLSRTKTGSKVLDITFGRHFGDVSVNDAFLLYTGKEWQGLAFNVTESSPGDSVVAVNVSKTNNDYILRSIGLSQPVQGVFGAKYYGTVFTKIVNTSDSSTVIIDSLNWRVWDGALVIYNNSPTKTFQLLSTTSIPQGFSLSAIQAGSGRVSFDVSASATPPVSLANGSVISTSEFGSRMDLNKLDQGADPLYSVTGDLWNAFVSGGSNIYVSQASGDDILGNGTEESPFATIGKAITEAGAPASPTAIIVTDSETYSETLTFNNPNVILLAPTATLAQSGVANTIEVSVAAPNQFFANIGVLLNTGSGSAFVHSGTAGFLINASAVVGAISGGDAVGTIRSTSSLDSNMTVNNGSIEYTCIGRQKLATDTITGAGIIQGTSIDDTRTVSSDFRGGISSGFVGGSDGRLELIPSGGVGILRYDAANNTNAVVSTVRNDPMTASRTFVWPDTSEVTNYVMTSSVSPLNNSNLTFQRITLSSGALAAGGIIPVIGASGSDQFRLVDIRMEFGTPFSGGGGDRDIQVAAGGAQFTVIPAAQAQIAQNADWGSTAVPFPTTFGASAAITSANTLDISYSGGTADYTSGNFVLTFLYVKSA